MVVGLSGDSGLTVQLLVVLGLRIDVEHARILFHNKMDNHVMVQMRILRSVFCHTALV